MVKYKNFLILTTICCLMTVSCQKDEQKLISKYWEYKSGLNNGKETTQTGFTMFYRDAVDIRDNGTFTWKFLGNDNEQGSWELNADKTKITFYYFSDVYVTDTFQVWTINKLTRRELWVSENLYGNDYEYYFKKNKHKQYKLRQKVIN